MCAVPGLTECVNVFSSDQCFKLNFEYIWLAWQCVADEHTWWWWWWQLWIHMWRWRGEGQWGGGGERRPDRTCLRSSAHTGYTCSQTRLIVMLVMRMEMVSGEEERWSQLTWLARIMISVNRTRIAVAKTLLTKKSFPMWMWSWSYVAADGWN